MQVLVVKTYNYVIILLAFLNYMNMNSYA